MRMIKLALISAVILIGLTLSITSLIPSHVRISRAVNIAGDQRSLSAWFLDLEDWGQWNELVKGIPTHKVQFYDHKLVTDSLTITVTLATADTVRTVWRNQSGREIVGVFALKQEGKVTIVQWYFDFHQKWFPWEKFASINFDKQWGPQMEQSLGNIKKIIERDQ